jgi:hypothetical protein
MNKFVNAVNGDVTINAFRHPIAAATTLADLIANANDKGSLCASIDADDVATICGNDWVQLNHTDFCCTLEIEGMAMPTYLQFTVSFDEDAVRDTDDLSNLDWDSAIKDADVKIK